MLSQPQKLFEKLKSIGIFDIGLKAYRVILLWEKKCAKEINLHDSFLTKWVNTCESSRNQRSKGRNFYFSKY